MFARDIRWYRAGEKAERAETTYENRKQRKSVLSRLILREVAAIYLYILGDCKSIRDRRMEHRVGRQSLALCQDNLIGM
jgi:hypothetical protein